MPVYALFIRYASGYTSVRTYASAFLRALDIVALSSQPVTLNTRDYQEAHGFEII